MKELKLKRNVVETIKTIVIAALISGGLGVASGINYQKHEQARVELAIKTVPGGDVAKK